MVDQDFRELILDMTPSKELDRSLYLFGESVDRLRALIKEFATVKRVVM